MLLQMNMTGGQLLWIIVIGILSSICTSEECNADTCLNNGQCSPLGNNGYRCTCVRGWTGRNCEQNIDDCYSGSCKNGGQCIDQPDDRYICNCTERYVGNYCEYDNPCMSGPCLNGGICKALADGTMYCHCSRYFKGDFCEMRVSVCQNDLKESRRVCGSHGTCHYNKEGRLRCKCDRGFDGLYCRRRLRKSDHDVCIDGYCLNGGQCRDQGNGSRYCFCGPNYRGKRCESNITRPYISTVTIPRFKNTSSTMMFFVEPSRASIACTLECTYLRGNGICEQKCNNEQCQLDGGDCTPWKRCSGPSVSHCPNVFRNNRCDPECNNVDCLFDGRDCDRTRCINDIRCSRVYQNGVCNDDCNNPQCGFDGGDCQWRQSRSFFANTENVQTCFTNTKEFELDLVLLTTLGDFRQNQSAFLQSFGSFLKMVLSVYNLTETTFNLSSAVIIKLQLRPSECVIYGGQCFSSLEQITNFIKASIINRGSLQLPFRIVKVDSKIVYSAKGTKPGTNIYLLLFVTIGSSLIISIVVILVLLRDKWRRMKTKVKVAGTWTPSDGYSTSILSINSNKNVNRPIVLMQNKNQLCENHQNKDNLKSDYMENSELEMIFCDISHRNSRKRRHDISNLDDNLSDLQALTDCIQRGDGIHPIGTDMETFRNVKTEPNTINSPESSTNSDDSTPGIGGYVNETGENLLHIASRMNSGSNAIKTLHSLNQSMLHNTDKWGRTPLATAVSSDSLESVQQLLALEKQARKDYRQNKGLVGNHYAECSGAKTTGLIEAVKLNSMDMINLLLNEGSAMNVIDSMGRSVIHWAAIYDNVLLLEKLSRMKLFQRLVDQKDNEEKTPIFLAASEGSIRSVKFILDFIRKHEIKVDVYCPSPIVIAKEKGFKKIVDILAQYPLPIGQSDTFGKKEKQGDKKQNNLALCHSQNIESNNECSIFSTISNKTSSNNLSSFDFAQFPIASEEDIGNNNSQSYEKSHLPFLKSENDITKRYISNSSSSDMSPPILELHKSSGNTLQSEVMLRPRTVGKHKTKQETFSDMYQLKTSSNVSQNYQYLFCNDELPSVFCSL